MVQHIIRGDDLLIARIFPITQLTKYPHVLQGAPKVRFSTL